MAGLLRQIWQPLAALARLGPQASASGVAFSVHQRLEERLTSGQRCSSSSSSSGAADAPAGSGGAQSSTSSPARPPRAPWTPTRLLDKRKEYRKRMRHLITTLEGEYTAKVAAARPVPDFTAGDILEVQVAVPEADRKVYTYRGVCVARAQRGARSWFKLYNVFPDVGGFVQHFPLYMPDLVGVRVVGRLPRAKRAKLYHLLENESPAHTYQTEIAPPK